MTKLIIMFCVQEVFDFRMLFLDFLSVWIHFIHFDELTSWMKIKA